MKHWSNWIVADPKVMMGKPVISGTRITVELILEKLMTSLPPVAACSLRLHSIEQFTRGKQ